MNILCIVDEDKFFHPQMLNSLYELRLHKNFKIGIIKKLNPKSDIRIYLLKNIFNLKLKEIFILTYRVIKINFLNFIFPYGLNDKRFFSIESFAKKRKIDYFYISEDINKKKYLDKIKKFNLDIIFLSCSQFIKDEIIKIPKITCINRHNSILPKYKGLMPVFHAIANNEKYFGSTLHKVTNKYDEGDILSQNKLLIKNKNIFTIYEKLFNLTSVLFLEAMQNISNKNIIKNKKNTSYFSFPTKYDWQKFRLNGGRFL